MDSLPPYFNSGIFNTSAFYTEKDYLTKDEADKLYLSINTSNNFAALIGVIPGIASASKALIVDTNRDINNINQLSLTGKLVLDQTQSIGFYRNTSTLDINSYIAPETGNTANLTLYSLRGNGSIKVLANNSGTNPLFLVNATSSTTPSTTDYLRILGNGNIGISNNNPAYLLDVSGSINSNSNIQVNRTTNGECFIANNGTVRTAINCQASQAHIGTTTNHSFNIQTNGANRLFILNNGNCGIDTSTPACKLDLLNGTIRVLSGTTNSPATGKGLEFSYSSTENKGNIYSFDRTAAAYQTLNLNDRMTILGNGNVGIGITNPTYQLELASGGTGINTSSLKFDGTTFNQNYYISMLLGGAEANKAVVLNSDKDYSGIRNLSITGGFIASTSIASPSITCNTITGDNGAGSSILNLAYTTLNLNGTSMTASATELNYNDITTLGTFQTSKTMTLNSSGIGLMPLGNTTSNCLRFYGNTANKEIICVFRDSDDEGLTIATKAQTIQKCSPLLHLYSGYDQTGVIGTSSAEYKEVIRSEHKLVGFADNYKSGWFHGYLLGTPTWKSSGFGYGTQFYTSLEALNIAWNSSTTSSFTSGNNLLLYNNQMTLGTTTPQSTYQLTLGTTSGKLGIYMNSTSGAGIYIKGQWAGATTGRLSIDMEDNAGNVYEYGIRGTTDNPTGWYWYVGSYKMVLTRATNSRLGLNIQSPTAGLDIRNTNTVGRFSDNTCFFDIWMNTAGLFGRRCFIGTSSDDSLTIQTNNAPRMTITNDGWIGIGTETPRYPLEVANTRNGQEGSQNYYYYLGPGSSNGSTTTTPSNISIRSLGRLLVNSEIDVISDFRKKENIELLNLDYCERFIKIINPKKFNYKNDPNGRQFGYIAQDLIKNQFSELIMVEVDNESEEYIDEDGFISEANRTYTLSRSQIIAILHNVIKSNVNKIKNLDDKLDNYINTVDTITVQQRLLNKINQLEQYKNELQIINNNLESRLMEQEQKNINLQSRLEIVEKWISETEVIQ